MCHPRRGRAIASKLVGNGPDGHRPTMGGSGFGLRRSPSWTARCLRPWSRPWTCRGSAGRPNQAAPPDGHPGAGRHLRSRQFCGHRALWSAQRGLATHLPGAAPRDPLARYVGPVLRAVGHGREGTTGASKPAAAATGSRPTPAVSSPACPPGPSPCYRRSQVLEHRKRPPLGPGRGFRRGRQPHPHGLRRPQRRDAGPGSLDNGTLVNDDPYLTRNTDTVFRVKLLKMRIATPPVATKVARRGPPHSDARGACA